MKKHNFLLVLFSSILFPLALPNELFPYGNWLIGLFSLSPLFIALALTDSFKSAAVIGAVFGALTSLLTNYWLMFFKEFSIWTLGGTTLAYAVFNTLLALFLYGAVKYKPQYRPFLLAICWAVYEYFKSTGFLGYPWGLIAYPVNTVIPMIQFVDITGIWGLSFIMALINSIIAEIILYNFYFKKPHTDINRTIYFKIFNIKTEPVYSSLIFTIILIAAVFSYGYIKIKQNIPFEKKLKVLLVQQNTDSWMFNGERKSILINEKLTRKGIEEGGTKPDIVVWSETSLMHPAVGYGNFFENYPKENPLLPFIRRENTYFLIGAPILLKPEYSKKSKRPLIRAMNAVVLFNPEGNVVKYYGKQHPVPFAESIPFWDVPWVREFFRRFIGIQNVWVMGKSYTIFNLPLRNGSTVKFGTPICFEDAFSPLIRTFVKGGAELLINLTNDSWSKTVSSETQHFVAAKFRSVENKRVLIRSTTAGVTSIIDPWGRELKSIPLFKEGYLSYTVPVYKTKSFTFYTRYGDYFPRILMIILFIFLLCNAAGYAKRKNN
ncbi:MAG: apolipoprotein N-acyltransferase [Spirochaetes bacterium]|nr:apolipoprotein N-acyltransferase [Spirochaetota bacterium]